MCARTSSADTGLVRAASTTSPSAAPVTPWRENSMRRGSPMRSVARPFTETRGSRGSSWKAASALRTRNTRSPFPTGRSGETRTLPSRSRAASASAQAKWPLFVQNSSTSPLASSRSGAMAATPSLTHATRPTSTPRLFGRP